MMENKIHETENSSEFSALEDWNIPPKNEHPQELMSLQLSNFKAVKNQIVDLSPLTVIVGANSAGKSSLIQSILLMAQAMEQPDGNRFGLNGRLINLGRYDEVKNHASSPDEPILLGLRARWDNRILLRNLGDEFSHFGHDDLFNFHSFTEDFDEFFLDWTIGLRLLPESSVTLKPKLMLYVCTLGMKTLLTTLLRVYL